MQLMIAGDGQIHLRIGIGLVGNSADLDILVEEEALKKGSTVEAVKLSRRDACASLFGTSLWPRQN